MNRQIKCVEKILSLKKEHKDHEIHVLVDADVMGEEYSWYSGEITSVELEALKAEAKPAILIRVNA